VAADAALIDHGEGWVTQAAGLAGVNVSVSDNDPVRLQRIVDSVVAVDRIDAHGCAVDSPMLASGVRPTTGALPAVEDVTGASVCRYALPDGHQGRLPPLLSSFRADEARSHAIAEALAQAPQRSGPDGCVDAAQQMIVVILETAEADVTVTVRYQGRSDIGVDDGVVARQLTRDITDLVIAAEHGFVPVCVELP